MSTPDGAALRKGPDETEPLAAQLMDAAEAELDEHGASQLSLRAVARKVGVSHQAPGHHFGSRSGLLTAVAARGMGRFRGEAAVALAQNTQASARERLTLLLQGYAAAAVSHPGLFDLTVHTNLLDLQNDELRRERRLAWEGLVLLVAAAQAEGWHAGESTDILALRAYALVHGTVLLWSAGLVNLPVSEPGIAALLAAITDGL